MAVTTQESTQFAGIYTSKPPVLVPTSSWHGRVRMAYFDHAQSGAGDAGSSVALCKIPGNSRLLLPMSWLQVDWTTASATIDLGWDAYTDTDGNAVAADDNGLIDGLSVESADVIGFEELTALAGLSGNAYTKLFASKDDITIRATSPGAIADGDTISGVLAYVSD